MYTKKSSLIEKNALNNCSQKGRKITNLIYTKYKFKLVIKLITNKYY